ncbi:unnamed protein product [Colias eurytheme]|nr:unnamed protein product [Colias eurytheme]
MMVIKNLVIGLINICSLGTGHEELLAAMEQHNVDVLGINETWLKEGEEGRAPKFTGYRFVHIPRPSHVRGRGGGVGFYVRNSLNVKVLKHPCCLNVEQMWITLNIRCKKLVIGTAYRPPWLNVDTFVNAIHESVASFSWADNTIVMGDFNINFADKSTIGYRKLLEFLTMTSLTQIINQPTHFTDHSETIIDLICTDINVQRISVNHINDLSHHAFVSCELYIAKDKCIPLKIQYRPIKDINMELFETAMSSINWDAIIDHQDINNFVSNFNSIILSIYDCLAPIKHFLTCTFPSTWRKALIKPLPKTNNPNCLKDLRPISILPCLSKILEKVVCEQVRRYLDLNDMLPTRQSGFRKQNSTITALLDVVDNMLEAQDRGEGSLLILLDYSRAFDCINIDLLLCKLSYYGFDDDSLQWFKSYLSYRSQMRLSYCYLVEMSIHIKDSDDLKTRLGEAGDKLVVIDFMATWCGPCKVIGPKLDELANEMADSIVVLKVDVDECEDIATEYNINSMPTFVFVKNSKKLEEFSGANADKLKNTILKLK